MDPLVLLLFLYLVFSFTILWKPSLFFTSKPVRGNVLVVIAHPDDECMFFGPFIASLTNSISKVYILCLSRGDESGLGAIRQQELIKAASVLKVDSSQIIQINSQYLADGPNEKWDPHLIHNLIMDTIRDHRIQAVVTFDSHGVSGHPNHIAAFKGSKYLEDVKIYHLISTSIMRKYLSFLDLPLTWIESCLSSPDEMFVVSSSFDDYCLTRCALSKHVSQMMWFRKLYAIFSRYMFVNTFQVK